MLDLYSMSADPNPKTIRRIEEVLRLTGLKRTMLYDLIAKEKFPRQVSLGARAVGWYEDEVEDWIRNRRAGVRESNQACQNIADKTVATAAHKTRAEMIAATPLHEDRPKRSETHGATSTTVQACSTKRAPAFSIKFEDHAGEPMTEAEELGLLRKENAQLKKLVGELALKNSLLQPSAGLKVG